LVIVAGATITFGLFGLFVMATPLGYPRSVVAMSWGFTILAVGATRFAWRTLRRHLYHVSALPKADRVRALVYGAGQTGVMPVRQTRDDPQSHIEIVGFVDDDPCLQGMIIAGKRVLGNGAKLAELVARHNIDEIILALPSVAGTLIQRVMDQGRELGVRVRTVPRLLELLTGDDRTVSVRDIDLGDLIGRDTSCLNLALPDNYIEGRTILVTGAGGSIGSEICRQLCRYGPERVVLLGRGENRVHSIYYELTEKWPRIEFVPVIANITSREAMEETFDRYRPAVVIHAAAHKHVYLMEVNAVEAARNNVLGTELIVNLAADYSVERFIFVSTDKAVEPTSIMGATKRLCERIVASRNGSSKTKFMAVRFGNVLGSAGSVVPIFQRCARMGRPLQVTHPDVDRFFMTIEEASFLVLQAGALGHGGDIFVLDMGQPLKILTIARAVLEMEGKDPDAPGAITFIGLRPGEKLHEALSSPCEVLQPTANPRIRRIVPNGHREQCLELNIALRTLREAVAFCDEGRVRRILKEATNGTIELPEYLVATTA
jgi:FlaA1/EpsC-like NDP-sugar epimerase